MDGLNPPHAIDVPHFTNQVAEGYRRLQFPPPYLEQLAWIPIVRMTNFLERRLLGKAIADTSQPDTDTLIETAPEGFRQSRDIAAAIATLYDVPTLFFLQPNTMYNYDTRLFRNQPSQEFRDGKASMTAIYEQLKGDKEYIDLSGLFMEWGNRKAVVDDCHYNPGFNEFLARRVAEFINVDRLEPREMARPTGGVRTQ
jgi:hypothetical protein